MKFEPVYFKSFLKDKIINPEGNVGIVTLWSKPYKIRADLQKQFPNLFEKDSPLVLIANLYGNGLPQMLSNLAYNPQNPGSR